MTVKQSTQEATLHPLPLTQPGSSTAQTGDSGINLYQQALQNFGIAQLRDRIEQLNARLSEEKLDSLTGLLIQRLTDSLSVELISSFVNAMQQGEEISDLPFIHLGTLSSFSHLPANFPDDTVAHFSCGDQVRWRSLSDQEETDTGVVIGRFYIYASHHCQWAWKYLILLNPESPSARFCVGDTAWERDLESFRKEAL